MKAPPKRSSDGTAFTRLTINPSSQARMGWRLVFCAPHPETPTDSSRVMQVVAAIVAHVSSPLQGKRKRCVAALAGQRRVLCRRGWSHPAEGCCARAGMPRAHGRDVQHGGYGVQRGVWTHAHAGVARQPPTRTEALIRCPGAISLQACWHEIGGRVGPARLRVRSQRQRPVGMKAREARGVSALRVAWCTDSIHPITTKE
jgi:hypothetical protein